MDNRDLFSDRQELLADECDEKFSACSKECWQQIKVDARFQPKSKMQAANFIDFDIDDPLSALQDSGEQILTSTQLPFFRYLGKAQGESLEQPQAKQTDHESLPKDKQKAEQQSKSPPHALHKQPQNIHKPARKTGAEKQQSFSKHKQTSHIATPGNESQEPQDGDSNGLKPGMILGGAGGAPPPGGDLLHPDFDPDYCTLKNWFDNTVTVVNPEGKDPKASSGDKEGETEPESKRESKKYTADEIEQIISQFEHEHEREIAKYLLEHGEKVEKNPNEGRPGQGDALVNGENTEFKNISGVANQSSEGLSDALASRAMDARSQAPHMIINTTGQLGMTQEIAERGIKRAYGADNRSESSTGQKIKSIRVFGKTFDITVKRR